MKIEHFFLALWLEVPESIGEDSAELALGFGVELLGPRPDVSNSKIGMRILIINRLRLIMSVYLV